MPCNIYTKTTKINVPVQTAFQWHEQNGAIDRLTPPWAPLKLVRRRGIGIDNGVKVWFRLKIFHIPMLWVAQHTEYQKNVMFKDHQVKGPFSKWEHTHRFIPDGDDACYMEDTVEFKLPLGWLSRPLYTFARKEFDRMFTYRHRVLKQDLEHRFKDSKPKRILISGASGTIGSVLVPYLKTNGHQVIRLVRKKGLLQEDELFWDPYQGELDLEKTAPFDVVINLNGVDISRGTWTQKQKKKIIDSRIIPTFLLVEKIKRLAIKPRVFISSSAIGYYGEGGDAVLEESHGPGDSFISTVCDLWEDASVDAHKSGIRTVMLRIGVVLTPAGGALKRMELPFKAGLGVRLSHGRQYMSWISMDDAISGIMHIIHHPEIEGPVNLTAPNPVTNRVFSDTLAKVFSKKVYFVMPAFIAKLLWGQMGKETLLTSARVIPKKLLSTGFLFQHERLICALKDMMGR
ncbi:MAG: TIGR01777 family oxidoreductase [Proteobacteria bacterium]|nr:TIGR01777 family oxidoreductase [Pseudomonadota bacterium]MBU1389144.1 TIGR01777 family oxidoreductase [Pseudomonadota bacterium]MBU1543368.1 TIGR01777 family oxidoreductase [Pseudomonadota bacterium]MBU2481456.1 TIGR01777 family oxidoreductase [Pseudomonadota bacterium]